MVLVRGADAVSRSGRQHRWQRYARAVGGPRAVGEPSHAWNLHAREPGDPMFARPADHGTGRSGKAEAAILRCTNMGSLTAPYYRRSRRTRRWLRPPLRRWWREGGWPRGTR